MTTATNGDYELDGFRVEVLNDLGQLEELAAQWETLVAESPDSTAWTTPAAVITWFRLVRQHSDIHVVIVKRGEELVGVAPFSTTRQGPFRLYVTAGAGYGYYGDPALGSDSEAIARVIADYIQRNANSSSCAFYMRRMQTSAPLISMLGLADNLEIRRMSPDEELSVVRFDEIPSFDEYISMAAKKHQIPRLYRRLREQFDEVKYLVDDPEPQIALEALREMQSRRFGGDLRIFATAQNRALTEMLVRELMRAGHGRMSSLMADGERIAVAFIPHVGSRYTWYAVAYEPELRKYGLGHIDPYEMLASAHDSGAREVDLGDARFEYKRKWATSSAYVRTVSVTASGIAGSINDTLRRVATRLHRGRRLSDDDGVGPHII